MQGRSHSPGSPVVFFLHPPGPRASPDARLRARARWPARCSWPVSRSQRPPGHHLTGEIMLRKLAALPVALTSLALVACGPHKPVDFSQGVPTKQMATIAMPSSSSSGLSAAGSPELPASQQLQALGVALNQATQGETADLYRVTVGAIFMVTAATEWLL